MRFSCWLRNKISITQTIHNTYIEFMLPCKAPAIPLSVGPNIPGLGKLKTFVQTLSFWYISMHTHRTQIIRMSQSLGHLKPPSQTRLKATHFTQEEDETFLQTREEVKITCRACPSGLQKIKDLVDSLGSSQKGFTPNLCP